MHAMYGQKQDYGCGASNFKNCMVKTEAKETVPAYVIINYQLLIVLAKMYIIILDFK